MTVALSVIIPLYGFQYQREDALQNLFNQLDDQDLIIDDSGNKNFEVIFVEQTCEQGVHSNIPHKPYIKHITLPAQTNGFNKSWCMNVAANQASTDDLVFLDVDMIFDSTYFSRINAHKSSLRYFTCWSYIIQQPGKDNPAARVVFTERTHTAGGCFFTKRSFYWEVGGMNENYFGYGGEDNDMWIRVNRRLGPYNRPNITYMDFTLEHWYHDWAAPSPDRLDILGRTNRHSNEVTKRLKATQLGKPEGPTTIDVSDLSIGEWEGFLGTNPIDSEPPAPPPPKLRSITTTSPPSQRPITLQVKPTTPLKPITPPQRPASQVRPPPQPPHSNPSLINRPKPRK